MLRNTEQLVLQSGPPPLKVILTDPKNERERETLLDQRFHVIDAEQQSTASYTNACHKLFWRCLVGNFTYRLSVSLVIIIVMVKSK